MVRVNVSSLPHAARGVLVLLAVVVAGCGAAAAPSGSARNPPSPADPGTPAAAVLASIAPSRAPTPTPTSTAADPGVAACAADPATASTIVRLGHTFNYRRVVPGLGFLPQFDVLTGPAWLVVYPGQSPLRPPYVPLYPPTTPPGWTPAPEPTLAPGSSDVCLAVDGIAEPFIETYVPTTEIHPELANDERQPPVAGEGRVVGRLDAATWSLAWDPGRHVLWYVTLAGSASRLHRLDPATGVSASWRLPAGLGLEKSTDTGFVEQVAVDTDGGVWFEANGYILYRFDPATATFLRTKLQLKEPGVHWQDGGTWVSAILPYGNGVLVARNRVPWLTRYDIRMRVVGTIPLPNGYAGPQELARAGSRLVIAGQSGIGLFDLHGQLVQRLPNERWGEEWLDGVTRFFVDDLRRAAIWQVGDLALLDANGTVVTTVPVNLDLPQRTGWRTDGSRTQGQASAIATDWHGRWWYVVDGFAVEVHAR